MPATAPAPNQKRTYRPKLQISEVYGKKPWTGVVIDHAIAIIARKESTLAGLVLLVMKRQLDFEHGFQESVTLRDKEVAKRLNVTPDAVTKAKRSEEHTSELQ